jgi:hypothetical protein
MSSRVGSGQQFIRIKKTGKKHMNGTVIEILKYSVYNHGFFQAINGING